MRYRAMEGFTIIELLTILTVIGLTLTYAVPFLNQTLNSLIARQDIAELKQAIASAREQAVHQNQQVTLCPLSGNACDNDWNAELSMFTDNNNNRQLDTGETIIKRYRQARTEATRSYTGQVISFFPTGFSGINTGSFGYCLRYGDSTDDVRSDSLVISRLGRIRPGADSDGDGIFETASRRNIPCR